MRKIFALLSVPITVGSIVTILKIDSIAFYLNLNPGTVIINNKKSEGPLKKMPVSIDGNSCASTVNACIARKYQRYLIKNNQTGNYDAVENCDPPSGNTVTCKFFHPDKRSLKDFIKVIFEHNESEGELKFYLQRASVISTNGTSCPDGVNACVVQEHQKYLLKSGSGYVTYSGCVKVTPLASRCGEPSGTYLYFRHKSDGSFRGTTRTLPSE